MNESTITGNITTGNITTGNITTGYTNRKPEPTITVAGRVFTFDEAIELYEALKKLFACEPPTYTWTSTSLPYDYEDLLKMVDDTGTKDWGFTQKYNKG